MWPFKSKVKEPKQPIWRHKFDMEKLAELEYLSPLQVVELVALAVSTGYGFPIKAENLCLREPTPSLLPLLKEVQLD